MTNKDFFQDNKKKKLIINNENEVTNMKTMNMILNKLIRLKHKINEINYVNKRKNNLISLYKPKKKLSEDKKTSKNKYLLYINDYLNNKKKLLLLKNKTITYEFENKNIKKKNIMTENDIKFKTLNINNDSNNKLGKFNNLKESNINKNNTNSNLKNVNYFSIDKIVDRKIFYFD